MILPNVNESVHPTGCCNKRNFEYTDGDGISYENHKCIKCGKNWHVELVQTRCWDDAELIVDEPEDRFAGLGAERTKVKVGDVLEVDGSDNGYYIGSGVCVSAVTVTNVDYGPNGKDDMEDHLPSITIEDMEDRHTGKKISGGTYSHRFFECIRKR